MAKSTILCDRCSAPATFHSVTAVAGNTQDLHLCAACAAAANLLTPDQKPNLPAVVEHTVGQVAVVVSDLARLQCPDCGITFMEFRRQGRFGCARDYEVFRVGLLPLLERVHRAEHHTGKRPHRSHSQQQVVQQLRQWRAALQQAIEQEDFAEAVRLRDLIRAKEQETWT